MHCLPSKDACLADRLHYGGASFYYSTLFFPFQFKQAEETTKKLDLDGLVVIGGDDSNTNACLLAENFGLSLL